MFALGPKEPTVRQQIATAALGFVAILCGLVFHAVAAYYRPGGVHPLDPSMEWAFLSWGWLRLVAWASVAGGGWLLAVAWTKRPGADG